MAERVADVTEADLAVCPPFVYLAAVSEAVKGSNVAVGGQDCFYEEKGAFTGEVSPAMLKDAGCTYVILGHSERRHVIGEGDELINRKVRKTLEGGLKTILCVGELLSEREKGKMKEVVRRHVEEGLKGLAQADMKNVVIAYEPVWAIGTGVNATPEQAQEVHKHIREILGEKFGDETAKDVRIQYGGSVKPGNVAEIMAQEDVDGALVGGASLDADSFSEIVKLGLAAKR